MDTIARTEWETALARAALYEFLVHSFAFPSEAHRDVLRATVGPILAGLSTGDPAVDAPLGILLRALDEPLETVRAEHAAIFTHIEPMDCPPYESAHVPADIFRQTEVMADVAGFYRAHGLFVGGAERERPDHIVTELEFVAFMARKEAYALEHLGSDEVAECRRTRDHFLRDHLGCWGPDFGRRVALVGGSTAIGTAGELLAAWLDADLEDLGITPAQRLTEPVPQPEPDDDSCGATECTSSGCSPPGAVEIGPTRKSAP